MSAKESGAAVPAPLNSTTPELQASQVAKAPSAVVTQPPATSMATSKNSSVGGKPTLVKKVVEPKSPKNDNKGPVWTSEEHKVLEATLKSFPEENFKNSLERYIKLAYELPDKGVRDVALRVRWLQKKESAKRKRPSEEAASTTNVISRKVGKPDVPKPAKSNSGKLTTKSNNVSSSISHDNQLLKRENNLSQRNVVLGPVCPSDFRSFSTTIMQQQNGQQQDAGIAMGTGVSSDAAATGAAYPVEYDMEKMNPQGIQGTPAEILREDLALAIQIRRNIIDKNFVQNRPLLAQYRKNLVTLMSTLSSSSGVMKHMPPLQIKVDETLATSVINGVVI